MRNKILSLTKSNRRLLLYITILIFMLTTLLSYAYLNDFASPVTKTPISGTGSSIGVLTYSTTGDVAVVLDDNTFGAGSENIEKTITSSVTATSNAGQTYRGSYNAYLMLENEFTYSQSGVPEIILTVTGADDEEITELDNLTYLSEYGGFDITDKNGKVTLFTNRALTTTTSVTEDLEFKVTILAHDFDQSVNEGKNFNATIELTNFAS